MHLWSRFDLGNSHTHTHTHTKKNINIQVTSTSYTLVSIQIKEKPAVIAVYSQYMLGVDKLDQLTSYYSVLHKSVKWWRKIFLY